MSKIQMGASSFNRFFQIAIFAILLVAGSSVSQVQAADQADQPLSGEQIEQLVAPIALHPDDLLSQILMASTYPLEVVQAARWSKDNPKVTGKALEDAMEKQSWDPSVKSLAGFSQVLQMMNDDLAWTQQLGDAFLAQQEDVLDAVQRLRAKADKAGNLASTKEQKIEKQTVTAESGQKETVIVVQQTNPKVIYVPAYNPTVIYGPWAYPAYPPYYWYPPGYVARRAFWFGVGIVAGNALWGRCNWGRRSVNININRYNTYNRTRITNNKWNHNPRHRGAVPYRGRDVAKRYGKGTRDVRSREQFRGRAEAGRRDLQRPGGGLAPGGGQRPNIGQRPGGGKLPGGGQRPDIGQRPAVPQRPSPSVMPSPPTSRPAPRPSAPVARPTPRPSAPVARPSPRPSAPVARPAPRPSLPAARPTPRPSVPKIRPVQRPSPSKRPAAFKGLGKGKQVRRSSSRGKASRGASRARPSPSKSRGGGGRGRGGGRRR